MKRLDGKKIDVVTIKTRAKIYKLEVRYVKDERYTAPYFYIPYGGEKFRGSTPAEAEKVAKEALAKLDIVEWQRFISIGYTTYETTGNGGYSSMNWRHGERTRPTAETIAGLCLTFSCYDYSKEPSEIRQHSKAWLVRDVTLDMAGAEVSVGTESHEDRGNTTNPFSDLIPFTPRRWQVLAQTRAALFRLDEMLSEVFGGDEAGVAKALDNAKFGGLLLLSAKKEK